MPTDMWDRRDNPMYNVKVNEHPHGKPPILDEDGKCAICGDDVPFTEATDEEINRSFDAYR